MVGVTGEVVPTELGHLLGVPNFSLKFRPHFITYNQYISQDAYYCRSCRRDLLRHDVAGLLQ